MRRFLALTLVLAACGGGTFHAPPAQPHIALPTGAALKPFDPAKPGEARPNYTAQLNGIVYAGLTNSRLEGGFPVTAGPGFLAAIDPTTGTVNLIDLGGADGRQCTNPGVVRADSGKLYVVCSGSFDGTDPSRALVEVDPGTRSVTRRAAIPQGTVPSGIAVTAKKIWIGDQGGTNQLLSFDRSTFAPADGADAAHPPIPVNCPTDGKFPYVPYVGTVGGDVYALCATTTAGALGRHDPATGASKGQASVGASPTQFAGTSDGRIAVVNSLENTLSLVSLGNAMSSQVGLTFKSPTSTLQDVKSRDQFLFTVASGSNTVQKIDLTAPGGPKVIAEGNTGNGSSPFNLEPIDDDQVVVVNYATSDVVALNLTPQ
ncbi:MAG: hypothetical protein ACJ79T_20185 [Myxococcales bacterium]